MHLLTHLHCILGLEGVRDLIVKVAAEMKERKTVGHEEIYPTVYALCAIHGSKNAKITDSNMRSLVVQWAKCGNDEDVQIKEEQMTKAKITASSMSHLQEIKKEVTYVGLNLHQKLQTNYEVVRRHSFRYYIAILLITETHLFPMYRLPVT